MLQPDRASGPGASVSLYRAPRPILLKYERIVEIIRAHPDGISAGGISKQYYGVEVVTSALHHRMQGMLLQICYRGRIKCVNNDYFINE